MANRYKYLIDNNVLSEVFKGNEVILDHITETDLALCAVVYIEALQGSKSNEEKRRIKKFLHNYPLFLITPMVTKRAIDLVDQYSNSHGLLLADALIAATALEHGLIVLTYNINDFKFIDGLKWEKPTI